MKDTIELRKKMIDACLWMRADGLVFGTWGNISVRLDDGNLLITPSRIAYETMQPEDLVVISPEGTVISGKHLPTSERDIHRLIMNRRKDIGAIIHTHSLYAMAAAARNEDVPALTEEMCQLIGGAIPLSSHFVPSHKHLELGEVVSGSVTEANAILIRNHGPVCFGRDLEEAKVCCQIVEKSCQIYLQLLSSGGEQLIEQQYVETGRDYYLNGYGKS